MRSPGINGEGELRGQPASPGSPGKMAVKTVCVNRTTIPSPNSVKSTKGNAYKFFQCFNTVGLTSESASDMGYLCANFSLIRPICSQLRPDVRDRQHHRFAAAGPRLWNLLLRQCRSLEQFKRLLKTFLFSAWGVRHINPLTYLLTYLPIA